MGDDAVETHAGEQDAEHIAVDLAICHDSEEGRNNAAHLDADAPADDVFTSAQLLEKMSELALALDAQSEELRRESELRAAAEARERRLELEIEEDHLEYQSAVNAMERLLTDLQCRAEKAEGALARERREHASRMCAIALQASDEELERRVKDSDAILGDGTSLEEGADKEHEEVGEATVLSDGTSDDQAIEAVLRVARDKIEARRRRDHERAERATLKFVASAATAAKRGASVSQQHSSTTPSPNHHPPHRAPLTHAAAFADLTAVSAYSLCHGVSLREGLDQWSHVLSQAAAESAPFRPGGVGCMMRQRKCGEVNLHELHMS